MSALLAAVLLSPGAVSAQSPTPAQSPNPAPHPSPGYRIGPRDLLEVKIFEAPELTGSRRVNEEGKLSFSPAGDVDVAGLTEAEAAQKIKELLEAKSLVKASVSVLVQEFRSRPISVLGAVRQPGSLAFSGRWTLLEALTAAGGVTDGHGSLVYILRRSDNGLSDQIGIPLDDLIGRANQKANIPIFAGDLINVPSAVDVTIYCLGQFRQPGALTFKNPDRVTLLGVIARAGGLTDRASSKILIKRDARSGKGEINVDYKKILAGKEPDVELQSGDVVVVKESFF
jgi:polysaccharide export outer membrane protein